MICRGHESITKPKENCKVWNLTRFNPGHTDI